MCTVEGLGVLLNDYVYCGRIMGTVEGVSVLWKDYGYCEGIMCTAWKDYVYR